MRLLPLVTLLVAGTLRAAESPFDYPVASRRAEFQAIFTKVDYPERQREGTKLAIKDRDGKTLFEHELDRDVARNAEWTHDSKFLMHYRPEWRRTSAMALQRVRVLARCAG